MSAFHRRDPKVKCGDRHDWSGTKDGLQCGCMNDVYIISECCKGTVLAVTEKVYCPIMGAIYGWCSG